jgi:hypothetical protein
MAKAVEGGPEGGRCLESRERRTDTEMNSLAEGDVVVRVPCNVELLGL